MKKLFLILLAALSLSTSWAQQAERLYVATDRDWYAAGETLYLSAFCMDASGKELSPVSAVAYVELSSAEGMALSGKLTLLDGRGAGSLALPRNLPSGNYRLSAYTALSAPTSQVISVYNTLSLSRVEGGVRVAKLPDSVTPGTTLGPVQAALLPDGSLSLESPEAATLSISVYRNEPFPSYGSATLALAQQGPATPPTSVIPEYDGEILTLKLAAPNGEPLEGLENREVFISSPGHPGDIYVAPLQPDGTARFYTYNFFGSGDMVVSLEKGAPGFQVQLQSPFRQLPAADLPQLVINRTQSEAITRLGTRMQLTAAFDADTLYNHLPVREIPLMADECIRYILDDYTRFATLREVFVEYLSDIRVKGRGDALEMQVRCKDREKGVPSFREFPSLVLLDGVPILDHSLVYNLDPSLVRAIEVYPYRYAFGKNAYYGVAHFRTFKEDLGGIRFGNNVRMVGFTGPSYPVAFTPPEGDRYPQQRETLLWQPLATIQPGEALLLPTLQAPEGLVLVIQGLTASGEAIYLKKVF